MSVVSEAYYQVSHLIFECTIRYQYFEISMSGRTEGQHNDIYNDVI